MTFQASRYWDERHERTSGLAGVGFLGLRGLNPWMYRVRRRVFRRIVRASRVAVADARVLDVGSGTGFYLEEWAHLGARDVTGTDFSSVACQRLSTAYPHARIVELDIGTPDPQVIHALGTFDLISVMDVLYHVVEDTRYRQAFRNLASLLAPGGQVILTENFLQAAPRSASAWHVSRTLAEIDDAIRSAGLELRMRRPWFMIMNDPVDSTSRIHHRAWWAVRKVSEKVPGAGGALGAALYPWEVVLTKLARESPTSEIAIVARRPSP